MFGGNPPIVMDWKYSYSLHAAETGMSAGLMDRLAHMQTLLSPSDLLFAEGVLEQNISHENHLIFM